MKWRLLWNINSTTEKNIDMKWTTLLNVSAEPIWMIIRTRLGELNGISMIDRWLAPKIIIPIPNNNMRNNNNYNNGTNSHTNKKNPSSKIIHTWLIRKKTKQQIVKNTLILLEMTTTEITAHHLVRTNNK